jgi:NIMA-interacting peptidyl-prolyl cis-trans isomerase 1
VSLLVAVATAACDDKSAKPASVADASTSASPPAAPSSASSAPAAAAPAPAATSASAPAAAPDAIAAQHVLVAFKGAEKAPKGVTRTKADAKKRAEEVAAKAKSGTDFSALVAEYSDDPAAKERQGSLGKFTRDKMAKPFSDAAFALAVGESSGPVETPFGFHVIKRNQ